MDNNIKAKKSRNTPKMMPNSFEAEQSLLGAIMIDNNVGLETLSELNVGDFYYEAHRTIFNCMSVLQGEGKPIDIITMADKLLKDDTLDSIGGIGYITDLTNILPSSANYKYYFDIVKRNGMLRKIINASSDIIEKSYASDDADQALSYAEKKIFEISDATENKDLVHINDSVNDVIAKFEQILINPNGSKGMLTHFKNLDKITNGYLGGQMIVLAARPGVGKTSYAMNIVANIVKENPEKVVAVFNLEMSIGELTQRILLTMAQVPQDHVMKGATADEFKRLWTAKKILEKSNLFIDDTTGTTPEQIMSKCRRLKQTKKRLDFVVIDYLQLLQSKTQRSSMQQEVAEISRAIKIMAKELKVPVLILSQTSRDLEKRPDKTPKLSDLRDSGAIEQDADQVYFLIKDDKQENDAYEIMDLVICKHRNGGLATLHYKWEGSMVKFTPVTYEEAKSLKRELKQEENTNEHSNNAKTVDDEALVPPPPDNGAAFVFNSADEEIPQTDIEDITPILTEDIAPPEKPDWDAEFESAVNANLKTLTGNDDL